MIRTTHFKAGLFLVAGCGIVIGTLLWIGAASLFRSGSGYVSFFTDPVEGLVRGAAVNHLGVQVGRVTAIGLTPDQKRVRVEMQLDPAFRVSPDIVAELKLKGVTGQQIVALMKGPPGTPPALPVEPETGYRIIPAAESQLGRLEKSVGELSRKLSSLDVSGVAAAWEEAGRSVARLAGGEEIRTTLANARKASGGAKRLAEALSREKTVDALTRGVEDAAATAAAGKRSAEHVESELARVPPGTVADLARRMEGAEQRIDESALLFRQTVGELNRLLEEMNGLVTSLREEPGRILNRPGGNEPFRR